MIMIILITLLLLSLLLSSSSHRLRVVITGGTGVLGNALVKTLSSSLSSSSIYVGYRDIQKRQALYDNDPNLSKYLYSNDDDSHSITIYPTYINLDEDVIDLSFLHDNDDNDDNELILINNAAVFINGNDLEAMRKSFKYNCLKPAELCSNIINSISNNIIKTTGLTIINISSGDGELIYLNSGIRETIESIQTVAQWTSYQEQTQQLYDNKIEYAYGDTPFYSLSKALLNSYTQILNKESPQWCKVMSICPGNFESIMSTNDEENTFNNPMIAAEAVLKVALNAKGYQGGKFYRYGDEINY